MRFKQIVFNFLLWSICSQNLVFSQVFERIDHLTGLKVLEENNGAAVADYDGDNDLDILVVAKGKDLSGIEKTHSKLFRNNDNGTFTDVTLESGLTNLFPASEYSEENPSLDGVKYGVSWGDYDNDGYPDLFLTYLYKVQLFHNEGNGTFVETTIEAGIDRQNGCWNTSASWFDFNNDSYLDLFVSDWELCGQNTFYINNGDGTFNNVTEAFGLNNSPERSYLAFPFDFNEDGWIDIYITNDFQTPNDLFINNAGATVTEAAASYGLDYSFNDMGVAMGDYNKDGLFDIYVTTINSNALFKNNGNLTFTNVAEEENIKNTGWAWDTAFEDFDLDGDEDLFVVNGFNNTGPQFNKYFKNELEEMGGGFIDASQASNLNEAGESISSTTFDYDNDGDLDILVTNNDKEIFFYENKTINIFEESNLNWLKISLEGTISNKDAIGTIITVKTDKGDFKRYYNGISFLSQSLKPIHFGLGDISNINEILVKWPSGILESYQHFESNTTIKFTENQGFEITDIRPSIKIVGCTDPLSCNYNPEATIHDNSCEYLNSSLISGPTQSGFHQIANYTYSLGSNSTASWRVEGGEIISGQGTGQISVKWGLEATGKVIVTEISELCNSQSSELEISLNISRAHNDISIARLWNEALLEAIRNDYARPNVHARNLFHTSMALFDTWAIYTNKAKPYLIGNTVNGFKNEFKGFTPNEFGNNSVDKALSYTAYRLLKHRFLNSPGAEESLSRFDLIMSQLGYNLEETSIDYISGNAAALGNYIAKTVIDYGYSDGSQEALDYEYSYYEPVNPPLDLAVSGLSDGINDPNRWQPLTFNTFIDQSGNLINGSTPKFLGPEWGNVSPFALQEEDKLTFQRDGNNYHVYHDPGTPPQLNIYSNNESSEQYKWNFSLVSLWSSHLDPTDGVIWDISPGNIGNMDINIFSDDFADLPSYYKELEGGDIGQGHSINPITGKPYSPQLVPRADYARVLAEFWADGPDSETPPGHWFTILNYVSDHPLLIKKFNGKGDVLEPLEWDIKSYFILSGAMHDSAISAWGIKGWYDYIRPISAIRYMSSLGQSTDENLPNYHIGGIPLKEGFIELVGENDQLAFHNNENIGKIKVLAWKGHDYIINSKTDVAGVDWILAENWWPYQRPSFVTPPFAGYVSGHSTFSRAAAEVLTLITGDEFFPGGMGEFVAKKNEFLAFEKGPSVDITLQWATYRDASDQTSLSRIWGGIHPPADDIPGRIIGESVGINAYYFALPYFSHETTEPSDIEFKIFPNPVIDKEIYITNTKALDEFKLFDVLGKSIPILNSTFNESNSSTKLTFPNSITSGIYILKSNTFSKIVLVNN
ncbi:FG-GAP-like repeat-containing protein [Aestuariivivens marinum]|uniref:FG-GAP-like repeat-containing protein n=1 Tax=Aestuariivivens marinum TaxID=2913555 RepID=UPI001F58807E|nr:FG-GAP-like repeat-containing protein [Aestuariivivens marinum]